MSRQRNSESHPFSDPENESSKEALHLLLRHFLFWYLLLRQHRHNGHGLVDSENPIKVAVSGVSRLRILKHISYSYKGKLCVFNDVYIYIIYIIIWCKYTIHTISITVHASYIYRWHTLSLPTSSCSSWWRIGELGNPPFKITRVFGDTPRWLPLAWSGRSGRPTTDVAAWLTEESPWPAVPQRPWCCKRTSWNNSLLKTASDESTSRWVDESLDARTIRALNILNTIAAALSPPAARFHMGFFEKVFDIVILFVVFLYVVASVSWDE